jgi:hypothetical protein
MERDYEDERGQQLMVAEVQGLGILPDDGQPFVKNDTCTCTNSRQSSTFRIQIVNSICSYIKISALLEISLQTHQIHFVASC